MSVLRSMVMGRLDYLAFCVGALLGIALFTYFIRRRSAARRGVVLMWMVMGAVLIAGFFMTEAWGREQQGHMVDMVEGYAPTYAAELERMGHARVDSQTAGDDVTYLAMIEAQKRWLAKNPSVSDIYTVRARPEGGLVLIVDSETDYDHSGQIDVEREGRTKIGEPYSGAADATAFRALSGEPAFLAEPYTDRWGTWVTAFVPVRAADGTVEAALGVDFDAAKWVQEIQSQRSEAIGYIAVLIVAVAAVGGVAFQQMEARQMAAQLREQESVRQSEQRLSRTFEACPFPTAIIAADSFRCVQVNSALLDSTRRTLQEAQASSLWELGVTLAEEEREAVERAISSGQSIERLECEVQRDAGPAGSALLWLEPLALSSGPHLLAILQDVSEQAQLEAQLRQAQKLEAVGQLAAGIAHEINSPIQFIGDNLRFLRDSCREMGGGVRALKRVLDLAEEGSVPSADIAAARDAVAQADIDFTLEEMPRAIDESLTGVERVAGIVRAMKHFSHPGSDTKRAANLNDLVGSAVTMSRNEWKCVANVETHLDPELPPVMCDAAEISQVVLNLVVNAAHAISDTPSVRSGGTGQIVIATAMEECGVTLRVSDTGTGIPEEVRDRIFDPFFTTKEIGKGTGQGLFLAHRTVVEHHGGRISVESERGAGTTFTIHLPV